MSIKGWYVQHKETGNWHKLTDSRDTGIKANKESGGNEYKVEGMQGYHNQSKFGDEALPEPPKKSLAKEGAPQPADPEKFKEPLKKPKSSLKKSWELLKASVENAFPDMKELSGLDQVEEQQQQQQDEQQQQQDELHEHGGDTATEMNEHVEGTDELMQELKEQGYDEDTINHIVHGHELPGQEVDESEESEEGEEEPQEEQGPNPEELMQQIEIDAHQKMKDAELEHFKEMKEIEREFLQREKELDLQFKKQKKMEQIKAQREAKKEEPKD
jgi:hypothetical protein